jgi:flagellar hook assembly protein FlgD
VLDVAPGAQSVRWDGTDASGARVANGIYLASLAHGLGGGTARIVVVR